MERGKIEFTPNDPEPGKKEKKKISNKALFNAIDNNDWGAFVIVSREKDLDINKPDENGVTPLMAAVKKGNTGFISLILNRNPDLNAVAANGDTALSIAIQKKDWFSISILKNKGAKQ